MLSRSVKIILTLPDLNVETPDPLPWGEGVPLPALSSAGAGRVRGQFRNHDQQDSRSGQMANGKRQISNGVPFAICYSPFEL